MIGLLGKKIGMSQIFDNDGNQRPVTVLEVRDCYVADLKTKERDGYSAVKIGYGAAREKVLNRPHLGQLKKAGIKPVKVLREIRTEEIEGLEVGTQLTAANFEVGDYVDIEGVSIGRGFQGVVKRHHFKGGEAAHGAKFGREAGSIGQGSAFPSRVPKGRRMAGQMGNKRVTVQNLQVAKVDAEHSLVVVHGAVPGSEGGYVIIRSALKRGNPKKWKVETPKASAAKSAEDTKAEKPEGGAEDTSGTSPKSETSES